MPKWRKEENRGYVTTVMKNGNLGISVKGLNCFLLEGVNEIEPKPSGIQLVEVNDEEVLVDNTYVSSSNEVDLAEITLYALVGNPTANTMRIKGRIQNHEVVSLIDSGSTHNFLDAVVLPVLQLHLDISQILEVKEADGTILKTLGSCHGANITLQGHKFVLDFNVLHLGGCEVILGTQWLSTLGVISWNFRLLTMEFLYLGKMVFLKGLQLASSIISGEGDLGNSARHAKTPSLLPITHSRCPNSAST